MNEAERDEGTKRPAAAAPVNEEPFDEEMIDELEEPTEEAEAEVEEVVAEEVAMRPVGDRPATQKRAAGDEDDGLPFWGDGQVDDLRSRWTGIQTGFVDDPQGAVQQADDLLETSIRSLTDGFNNRRSALRREWEGNGGLSTEDLRVTMKRYRSFLEGLLDLEP